MEIVIRLVIPNVLCWVLIIGIGAFYGIKWGAILFMILQLVTPILLQYLPTNFLGRVRFAYVYVLALLGISSAQSCVALHYWNGWFVSRDKQQAMKWFSRLAWHRKDVVKSSWEDKVDFLERKYEELFKELKTVYEYECSNWRELHDGKCLALDCLYKNIVVWLGMATVLGVGDEAARSKLDMLCDYDLVVPYILSSDFRDKIFWPCPMLGL